MYHLVLTAMKPKFYGKNILRYFVLLLVLVYPCFNINAQSDPFGQTDRFYIESVTAGTGQDIPVRFYIENDEPIGSLSMPITYDPNILTLKSISFSGSRAEYIANKIITPSNIGTINGHFMVGMFIILEDPLPPGDGLIFTAIFTVSNNAQDGQISVIDTLFYPPAGEMVFIEASSSINIYPKFSSGRITVSAPNAAPVISSIPDQYVFEGENLTININTSDSNNDNLTIVCTDKPAGVIFKDNHNGTATINWQPDYIGPYSSDGSPFKVNVWVSDGDLSSDIEVTINVINKNRKPVITPINDMAFESGDLIAFDIAAVDPDFEPVTWKVLDLPQGAQFDYANPAVFSWPTKLTDVGDFNFSVVASDPRGYSDTSEITLSLSPTAIYELTLDTVSGYPGELVNFDILLDNKFSVSYFELLIQYDPTVLTAVALTNTGTRSDVLDIFDYDLKDNGTPGHIRIYGAFNQSSQELLSNGNGSIATVSFRIISNIAYGGMTVPVRFIFLDDLTKNDNTLGDTLGVKIEQNAILYYDGYVNILNMGNVRIGDINLNGIAYDIGDAIYFINYFMNPFDYPLNPLQYANSDINGDSFGGTISDLVALIKIVTTGANGTGKQVITESDNVLLTVDKSGDKIVLNTESDFETGAVYIKADADDYNENTIITNLSDNMSLSYNVVDSELRILIYSLDGNVLRSGINDLIAIENINKLELNSIEVVTSDGQRIDVEIASKNESLPEKFVLRQNYPNPFNPVTNISFDLATSTRVKLTVYNVLGKKVIRLIDEVLPAGTHNAVWDSHDENGSQAASGIYLYRLETADGYLTRKMVLLK